MSDWLQFFLFAGGGLGVGTLVDIRRKLERSNNLLQEISRRLLERPDSPDLPIRRFKQEGQHE